MTAMNYLEVLPLPQADKAKLAGLDANSALELLAILRASPEAMEAFLGAASYRRVKEALESQMTDEDRRFLEAPVRLHQTGALIGRKPPAMPDPPYDVAERDSLFEELQRLKRQPQPSPQTDERIRDLEQRLQRLLDKV